jgi:hypothetical protein
MNRLRKSIANASRWCAVFWISFGGAAASTARADEWQVKAGAEAPGMGPQALASFPMSYGFTPAILYGLYLRPTNDTQRHF